MRCVCSLQRYLSACLKIVGLLPKLLVPKLDETLRVCELALHVSHSPLFVLFYLAEQSAASSMILLGF